MTAPAGSVTVPEMLPLNCAKALEKAPIASASPRAARIGLRFIPTSQKGPQSRASGKGLSPATKKWQEENDFSAEQVCFLVQAGEPYARPKTMRNGSCVPASRRPRRTVALAPNPVRTPSHIGAPRCTMIRSGGGPRPCIQRRPPAGPAAAVAHDRNCEKQVNQKSRDNVCCNCLDCTFRL